MHFDDAPIRQREEMQRRCNNRRGRSRSRESRRDATTATANFTVNRFPSTALLSISAARMNARTTRAAWNNV